MNCCWPKKIHAAHNNEKPLTKQRSISFEIRIDQFIAAYTTEDEILLINKCKSAGIIPEKMEVHLRRRLNNASTSEKSKLENLHKLICEQIKAEHVQNVAESYRYTFQTYSQLQANCVQFGLEPRDIVNYFDLMKHGGTREERTQNLNLCLAVTNKQNCPTD
jgi:hypothetical protein